MEGSGVCVCSFYFLWFPRNHWNFLWLLKLACICCKTFDIYGALEAWIAFIHKTLPLTYWAAMQFFCFQMQPPVYVVVQFLRRYMSHVSDQGINVCMYTCTLAWWIAQHKHICPFHCWLSLYERICFTSIMILVFQSPPCLISQTIQWC